MGRKGEKDLKKRDGRRGLVDGKKGKERGSEEMKVKEEKIKGTKGEKKERKDW